MKLKLNKEWVIGEEFANGGFGRVCLARDPKDKEYVAKFVPKAPGANRELLFVSLENVKNVVPIVDSGETETDWVLIMPKADKSLRDHLNESGTLDVTEATKVLLDILAALGELDGRVVHRDIKPENILFLNGKWCLADFGISMYAEATTAPDTQKFALSPPYAAPERWRSERATLAADIYAIGVIAYEMIKGSRPFAGPDIEDYRDQHLHQRPEKLDGAPTPFIDFVDEALYKAPEGRPHVSNILARLNSLNEPGTAIVIEALQQANSAEVERKSEEARVRSEAQSAMERRRRLQETAAQSFEKISVSLRDAIMQSAPTAELARGSDISWFIRLNQATLELPPLNHPIITDWDYSDPPDIEVVATAEIILKAAQPNYGKIGRSHSLWFCDAQEKGQFEWYELGFMASPLWQKTTAMEPFALDPGEEAALAIRPITAHIQLGWPFISLKGEALTEFIQRWGTWFAVTSQNGYQPPSQMPERDTQGTYRH